MPNTLLGLGLAVAFVLPGFVIADLAESRRASRPHGDLELVLRGLAYALILQGVVALTGWTGAVLDDLHAAQDWHRHIRELAVFVLVIGVAVPTCLGLVLAWWLGRAEERGPLRAWHYALGARDSREAWDYIFSRREGAFLLLTLTEGSEARHFAAKYGRSSWASRAPTHPQEIYVEEAWPADRNGVVSRTDLQRQPARGMWISAEKIDRVEVLRTAARVDRNG